jgi:hypothetical protein
VCFGIAGNLDAEFLSAGLGGLIVTFGHPFQLAVHKSVLFFVD